MEIRQLSKRATAYIYDELEGFMTCVILIECENKAFLIDTFCGPESMRTILSQMHDELRDKKVIVINTHGHWDHIWGNCSFKNSDIISHELCRAYMDQSWEEQIRSNEKYLMGNVEKCLPNITFREKMIYHQEGIEIFYSPGHTRDSISVFDHREKILYAGDNLEKPIVHVDDGDVRSYIETLKNYLDYKAEKIVAGHTLFITREDVIGTIGYLEALLAGKEMKFETSYMEVTHKNNLEMIKSMR